ncbi:MAG: GNAT family N-acetyltransferase [Bacteroidia bacterium]|nr:GNAT family N-acetyltransferase [Bacteroidia bacterium]
MSPYEVVLRNGREIDPVLWDAFIGQSPEGAVFHLHGYASIIAAGWEAVIVKRGEEWEAVLPFLRSSRMGFSRSLQPRFAQYWGPCMAPSSLSGYEGLSRKKALQELLIEHLPPLKQIIWQFSPMVDYPLPWYWQRFTLRTRYTFQLDLSQTEPHLLSQTASTLRRYLKKGKTLLFEEENDPEALVQLLKKQQQEGHEIIGSNDLDWVTFPALVRYLQEKGMGRMRVVKNGEGQVLSAGLFVRYGKLGMYLIGTYDPELGDRSAMPILLWKSICEDQAAGMRKFDFEGSMIPGVERFFRRLGGQPVAYLQVERNDLPLVIQWIHALR